MNILQVCAYAAPYRGNFMESLTALDNFLLKDGINSVYAFPENAMKLDWVNELKKSRKVYFLPLQKANIRPSTYIKLCQIIKTEKIDIIHSHFELYDIPLAAVKPKKVKLFWHLHDAIEELYSYSTKTRRLLCKLHYNNFSKHAFLISPSVKHRDFVVKLGMNKETTTILPNAIDLQRIKKVISKRESRTTDFLIFGWEFKRKGVDIALKAGERLYNEGYKFILSVVGNDNTWREPEMMRYSECTWVKKQGFVSDVNELFSDSKTFLHISRAETYSYALQEAAYAGLPVICSDIPENLFAENIPTIYMVKNESVDDLYNIMKLVLDERISLSDEKIFKARHIIENEHSVEQWAERIRNIYFETNV